MQIHTVAVDHDGLLSNFMAKDFSPPVRSPSIPDQRYRHKCHQASLCDWYVPLPWQWAEVLKRWLLYYITTRHNNGNVRYDVCTSVWPKWFICWYRAIIHESLLHTHDCLLLVDRYRVASRWRIGSFVSIVTRGINTLCTQNGTGGVIYRILPRGSGYCRGLSKSGTKHQHK